MLAFLLCLSALSFCFVCSLVLRPLVEWTDSTPRALPVYRPRETTGKYGISRNPRDSPQNGRRYAPRRQEDQVVGRWLAGGKAPPYLNPLSTREIIATGFAAF
ncbi:hypothetical protein LZ31DRAFT_538494 [Colletotrichum somersetense]|nr:hypothetical protein LZ31DRAFT_538494 [Colletotrichum somersetense]